MTRRSWPGPTERTRALWAQLSAMFRDERARGVYDVDTRIPSSITSHAPGYIDREHELIVGLQTDAPLRRAIMPNGGLRMVENGLAAYGYTLDPAVREIFTRYRKTHNDGVFDAYPAEVLAPPAAPTSSPACPTRTAAAGSSATTAGWRCTASTGWSPPSRPRRPRWTPARPPTRSSATARNSPSRSARSASSREMAASYGYDITRPAATAREAIQWLYLAYLAAVKEQNGAAMSLGPHLDIPRHLPRARPARGQAHRAGGAGARSTTS